MLLPPRPFLRFLRSTQPPPPLEPSPRSPPPSRGFELLICSLSPWIPVCMRVRARAHTHTHTHTLRMRNPPVHLIPLLPFVSSQRPAESQVQSRCRELASMESLVFADQPAPSARRGLAWAASRHTEPLGLDRPVWHLGEMWGGQSGPRGAHPD